MPIEGQTQQETTAVSIPRRIWLGLLILLTLLQGRTQDQPVFFIDANESALPGQPTVTNLLDKIATIVGRSWCWMEAKLGLRPKDWPQA
jgi:hypothetical protein